MSKWQRFEVEQRVREILADINYEDPTHHFGRPFITAYQLAIEFSNRFPDAFAGLELPIGGEGCGVQTSLPQYLARELSRNIRSGTIMDIEGAFISDQHIRHITFEHQGNLVPSSVANISIFRLRR